MGLPPNGYIRQFTVGREEEIFKLHQRLESNKSGSMMLHANYGSGKSHLLRYIRESALELGYVVSWVELDSRGAVRFNRMDQIFGAICRGIKTPGQDNLGIRGLLDLVSKNIENKPQDSFWRELSTAGMWSHSSALESKGMYIALRAWCTNHSSTQDYVEDFLSQPWEYRSLRKKTYRQLVEQHRGKFSDPRSEWQFYHEKALTFGTENFYIQCWNGLKDIDLLAKKSGLKGLVILFDEYENAVMDLNNIKHQETAFDNLSGFYTERELPGMRFFAVTPDFIKKSRWLLQQKSRFDYEDEFFEEIPTFKMSPLEVREISQLTEKIIDAHSIAYNWNAGTTISKYELDHLIQNVAQQPIQDRTRQAITQTVAFLDEHLEDG